MHELGLTQEVVDLACEAAEREGPGTRVSRVILEIGRGAAVLPEALASCFELCAEGTPAQGARLEFATAEGDDLRVKAVEVLLCA